MKTAVIVRKREVKIEVKHGHVVELVDTRDLKSLGNVYCHSGSSPEMPTNYPDVTLLKDMNDYRSTVYAATHKGFYWLKDKFPFFSSIDLVVESHEADEFIREMKRAGLVVLHV